jgi:hypothetical protein
LNWQPYINSLKLNVEKEITNSALGHPLHETPGNDLASHQHIHPELDPAFVSFVAILVPVAVVAILVVIPVAAVSITVSVSLAIILVVVFLKTILYRRGFCHRLRLVHDRSSSGGHVGCDGRGRQCFGRSLVLYSVTVLVLVVGHGLGLVVDDCEGSWRKSLRHGFRSSFRLGLVVGNGLELCDRLGVSDGLDVRDGLGVGDGLGVDEGLDVGHGLVLVLGDRLILGNGIRAGRNCFSDLLTSTNEYLTSLTDGNSQSGS